jgi:Phosphatase
MRSKAQEKHARDVLRSARWRRGDLTEEALLQALVLGRMAGHTVSHDRANVRWKIAQFASGDPRAQFGLTGLGVLSEERVMALMGEAAGFDPDIVSSGVDGDVPVDPARVLARLDEAGVRLAEAAAAGERVLLATGHPVGMVLLYAAVGELLVAHGASLLRPLEAEGWRSLGRAREIRYLHGVAILTDRGSSIHTHSSEPMERMLAACEAAGDRPDLVFADHGFAGAAIEAGIDTISIADVNDPAPVAAAALGRTRTVIVMDDNVLPEDYWVCFQAIAARFPR